MTTTRCVAFLFCCAIGWIAERVITLLQAIHLDPDDDILYQNRATQLWIMGRLEEALKDFQTMVKLNPDCDEEAKSALDKVREELQANTG